MTDPIERELRNLLDERARGDPLASGALADGIAAMPPRRRSSLGTALPAAAALVVLTVALAVAVPRLTGPGAGPTPPASATPGHGLPGGRETASAAPAPTDTGSADPTPTPPPAPAWVADLAGQLECDGPVASLGSEVPEAFGVGAAGATPDEALGSFLGPNNPFASLPAAGYTRTQVDDHWASYAHSYSGKTKAIIVLSDTNPFGQEPGWLVIGLRACDASEFDPAVPLTFPVTIWTDAAGEAASTETIRSSGGPGHCGWDAAIWLNVGGNLYFRDPSGVMKAWTITVFEPDAQLPAAAVDTGYRTGEWSLWLDPSGDAYLVSPVTIERWPRSTDPNLACA